MTDDAGAPEGHGPAGEGPSDFIRDIVAADRARGAWGGRTATRFPPEPNGYLHVGHVKSIALNFGLAQEFGGTCNLRLDDTNPTKESTEYVEAIQRDILWLGFRWSGEVLFASDYFEQLYRWAERLIEQGDAYVDEQSADEIRATRGTLTEPGTASPWRDRPAAESLDLFRRMRAGEFADGSKVLRAKIDMASPNLNLRDPTLYRIRRAHHHRTGDAWCLYPMYDWAHGQSDAIEGITHSICTLEFEDHRPLYEWFLARLGVVDGPRQIEFARLALTHTITSKRKLLHLVTGGHVSGWDDPRMPTVAGMRRRGYTPAALRAFCARIGVARHNSTIDFALLEHALRDDLNRTATRRLAVLRPLELVVENWPEGHTEDFEAVNNPEDPAAGARRVPFGRRLWIERDDFREVPPKGYHRLSPGKEVRLRYACIVKCTGVDKDPATGEVVRVRCTWDEGSRGGNAPDGRKIKSTIHWVAADHAVPFEARLYDHLFPEDPDAAPEGAPAPGGEGEAWLARLLPNSLEVVTTGWAEPALREAVAGVPYQLERVGYFCLDPDAAPPDRLVLNRTIGLRDTWAKLEQRQQAGKPG